MREVSQGPSNLFSSGTHAVVLHLCPMTLLPKPWCSIIQHMKLIVQYFLFWKNSKDGEPGTGLHHFMSGFVRSSKDSCNNVTDNIESLKFSERVIEKDETEDILAMVRPKQILLSILAYNRVHYSHPGDRNVDYLTGTLSVARAVISM